MQKFLLLLDMHEVIFTDKKMDDIILVPGIQPTPLSWIADEYFKHLYSDTSSLSWGIKDTYTLYYFKCIHVHNIFVQRNVKNLGLCFLVCINARLSVPTTHLGKTLS